MTNNINVDYTGSYPGGGSWHVSLYGATPEQVAVISWLRAEDAWKSANEWQAKEHARQLKREREAQERAEKIQQMILDHGLLVEAQTLKFRRDMLERHGPNLYGEHKGLIGCRACESDRNYDSVMLEFPCKEYRWARDWEPDLD